MRHRPAQETFWNVPRTTGRDRFRPEENSRIRSLLGFALLAIVAWFALQLFFGLFGFVVGIFGRLLWLAFLGFLVYLMLKVFAPETAARVREMISGKA